MHGYFVDIRLYRKALYCTEPFAYEEYRRKKIREKIDSDRTNRVQVQVQNNKITFENIALCSVLI